MAKRKAEMTKEKNDEKNMHQRRWRAMDKARTSAGQKGNKFAVKWFAKHPLSEFETPMPQLGRPRTTTKQRGPVVRGQTTGARRNQALKMWKTRRANGTDTFKQKPRAVLGETITGCKFCPNCGESLLMVNQAMELQKGLANA